MADFRMKLICNIDYSGEWIVKEFEGAPVLCCLDGPVDIVDAFSAKFQLIDCQLLTTRIMKIEDD